MKKKSVGLLFRFALLFSVFVVVTLLFSGIANFMAQTKSYKQQCRDNIRDVGEYLESLIRLKEEDFYNYHSYFMANHKSALVPFDFDEFQTAESEFVSLFAKVFTGRQPSEVRYSDYPPELKKAHFKFMHEYWTLIFEKARTDFNLPYTYFITPVMDAERNDGSYDIYYVVDGERTVKRGSTGHFMKLGDSYHHEKGQVEVEWKVWNSGKRINEFQEWNNSYGHTYTYYIPVTINGKKLGLIGTEIDVAYVNRGILENTLVQTAGAGAVLILCTLFVLIYINLRYVRKIKTLANCVQDYSQNKNVHVVKSIEMDADSGEELSLLANQTSSMILELDNYTKRLIDANKEIAETKNQADTLQRLATRDALTGIRNKTAYDEEIKNLKWRLEDGDTEFGIVMVDLNFLKRINDTYGHEHGNFAIKTVCRIVCSVFEHSPVFRIGGDEFVVILREADYKHIVGLEYKFNKQIDEISRNEDLEPWEQVSAALGYALFDPEKDVSVENVFKRADKAMYAQKKKMKAVRK